VSSELSPFMHALDLDSTMSRQSCDWLAEVALRLNVVVEVVDGQRAVVCPVGRTLDAATLRRTITGEDASLLDAIADAAHSKTPVPVAIEGLQALCFGLAPGGTLLVARRLAVNEQPDDCRQDLESIGAWLTGALEASLGQPNAVGVEPYRIVSFRRILHEATARGSLRRVVGAFVEALSVWDDVRVSGYVAGAAGGFFQYVSTMAAHPSSTPEHLEEGDLPSIGRMVRLTRAEADRLGLAADPGDTLILRLLIGTESEWVLVFAGMIDDRVEVRLRVYSDMLRESLNDVLSATTTRVVAEVARRPTTPAEPIDTAVRQALDQLTRTIGARQAALILATPAGRQTLAIGSAELVSTADQARANRLVARSSDAGGVITVVVERDQAPFAVFEREIIQAAVAAIHPWVQAAGARGNDTERRQSFRPIDLMFDQLATEAVASGQQASVIVMSIDVGLHRPGLLPMWVGRIRGQLRGGDRAGILSDREIAVLLCGASADQAAVVSSRLKRMLESDDGLRAAVHTTIGVTTRVPDLPFEGSLVDAARASAAGPR
jgi:hypothetical protein